MTINYVVLLKRIAIPLIVGAAFLFYKYFPNIKQDSLAEEIAEEFIVVYTGYDIDLSPETPETK